MSTDGIAPTARTAATLHAEPGHVVTVRDGSRWRWDGGEWHPLQPGDTVLHGDCQWFLWDGKDFRPAVLGVGAVCRVSWFRDGVVWDNELVGVEALAPWGEKRERGALVRRWPNSAETATVPLFALELIGPAGEVPRG